MGVGIKVDWPSGPLHSLLVNRYLMVHGKQEWTGSSWYQGFQCYLYLESQTHPSPGPLLCVNTSNQLASTRREDALGPGYLQMLTPCLYLPPVHCIPSTSSNMDFQLQLSFLLECNSIQMGVDYPGAPTPPPTSIPFTLLSPGDPIAIYLPQVQL